jgi:putative ABC transport system permease protein
LMIPTYYAYDQLAKRGTLALRAGDSPDELFQDPLLVLVPALFVLTTALLAMRLFPWFMRLLDLIASHTPWLMLHLALRQLGRSSQGYINPLLLVVVALGMGVYTRAMAASLDQWLVDQVYYRIGTDITFQPVPPPTQEGTELPPNAVFIPPTGEFLTLPGVQAVTRVGDYRMRIQTDDGEERGRMLAVDRVEFGKVAWFRNDFASQSLGGLMNELALAPEAVLVTRQFLTAHRLAVGDEFTMRVAVSDDYHYVGTFRIAGVYSYFPTVQPDEMTVIGNLEHLFTQAGSEFSHQIWLRMADGAEGKALFQAIPTIGIEASLQRDAHAVLAAEQAKMERVGIFGTLSVGFLAAAVMAMLALLVHSYASLQERLYQFGVMRAIGLMHRQVIGQVTLEYAVLTAYGALIGAATGLITAELFAPFFRIPEAAGAPPPPLIPLIQQEATLQFALTFAGVMILVELGVLIRALSTRLFDALRMGHQG